VRPEKVYVFVLGDPVLRTYVVHVQLEKEHKSS
jgi:hypothetical protein